MIQDDSRAREAQRLQIAQRAGVELLDADLAFVESTLWSWDVWDSKVAPVIVVFDPKAGHCSIGCRDDQTASSWFGAQGLLNITPLLKPAGWRGLQTIIGSPGNANLKRKEALLVAQNLKRCSLLARLRRKRASGRVMEVEIGVRLLHLREKGTITSVEYDYVMGFLPI